MCSKTVMPATSATKNLICELTRCEKVKFGIPHLYSFFVRTNFFNESFPLHMRPVRVGMFSDLSNLLMRMILKNSNLIAFDDTIASHGKRCWMLVEENHTYVFVCLEDVDRTSQVI